MRIPERWCLYARLSYAPDGSVEKVERQEKDGRDRGRALRWGEPCCVYVDNSRSAWQRNRKRPDWDRMLRTMDASGASLVQGDPKADHVHDGIMTYHGDRLIRQPFDLELLLNLAYARDLPLASVTGVRNLNNADDRFILRIEAAQACRASDDTSRRVKRGRLATAVKGRQRPGGRRTFGWGLPTGEVRKVIDPETDEVRTVPVLDHDAVVPGEVKYLKECGELVLAGLSGKSALHWLNSRTLTSGGRPWTERGMKQALMAYRMAGYVEKNGELYEAVWDPVYAGTRAAALEMVEAIRAIFAAKADRFGYHGRARKHLLTGIAECSDCHAPSAEEPTGGTCPTDPVTCEVPHRGFSRKPINGTHYYYCPQCNRGRTQANFDAYMDGRLLRILNSQRFMQELEQMGQAEEESRPSYAAEIAVLKARKAEVTEQLKQLADHPNLNPLLLAQSLASFDEKIEQLQAKAAAVTRNGLLGRLSGISLEAWHQEDITVRADALRMLYRVLVYRTEKRGPGFDTSTVKLIRKKLKSDEAATQRPAEASLSLVTAD
ncbi:recombinase family protein [Streptomyces sp. NPDC088817]|uniref:recombinase family protein n=1 Tax=Streptomyces sp. NPDC088817 TaxID=3365907 RepID=UPI0038238990